MVTGIYWIYGLIAEISHSDIQNIGVTLEWNTEIIYIYNYIKLDNFQVFVTIARQGGAF